MLYSPSKSQEITHTLYKAVETNNIADIYDILERHDVNFEGTNGNTILHTAAALTTCNDKSWEALLDRKVNLNIRNNDGDTPLHIAAVKGNFTAVQCLLEAGADSDIYNNALATPADAANQCFRSNIARLIEKFADKQSSLPTAKKAKNSAPAPTVTKEEVPEEYECPISLEIMEDPVITPSGITYERASIMACIHKTGFDPQSKTPLTAEQLIPNLALRSLIEKWNKAHPISTTTFKM